MDQPVIALGSPLEQVLRFVPAIGTLPAVASRLLPYESTDPARPGMVHAVGAPDHVLVSWEALAAMKRESDAYRETEPQRAWEEQLAAAYQGRT